MTTPLSITPCCLCLVPCPGTSLAFALEEKKVRGKPLTLQHTKIGSYEGNRVVAAESRSTVRFRPSRALLMSTEVAARRGAHPYER